MSLTAVLNNHGGQRRDARWREKTRQVVTGQDKKRFVREETQAETELFRVERRGKACPSCQRHLVKSSLDEHVLVKAD